MHSCRLQFNENLIRVRELGVLADAVDGLTTSAIDVSDLWRAQVVLVVSAFDNFVHDITRVGMIECAKGQRPKTDAYLKFELPLSATDLGIAGAAHAVWIGETVRRKHSWQSFQDPDKVADAIRLVSPVRLWEEVGRELSLPPAVVKTRLKLIVDRRNKIAHEADLDPANPGFRWTIDKLQAFDTVNFIESLANAIYRSVV